MAGKFLNTESGSLYRTIMLFLKVKPQACGVIIPAGHTAAMQPVFNDSHAPGSSR